MSDIVLDLKVQTELIEGKKFWNNNEVELKFSFEREWIKAVRRARGRPNYGMGNMNGGLEEVCGNKLELSGPLVDSYLFQIGKQISSTLEGSIASKSSNSAHSLANISPHNRIVSRLRW